MANQTGRMLKAARKKGFRVRELRERKAAPRRWVITAPDGEQLLISHAGNNNYDNKLVAFNRKHGL